MGDRIIHFWNFRMNEATKTHYQVGQPIPSKNSLRHSDIFFMFQSDRFSRSGSVLSDIHESGVITDFSPPLSISSSGASYHPSLSPSSMSSSVASAPIRPRRRSGIDRNSLIDNQLHYGVADDIGYWFTFNQFYIPLQ